MHSPPRHSTVVTVHAGNAAPPPPPQIRVHAFLPRSVVLDGHLDLRQSNWHWVHSLTIPLETLSRLHLSERPFKWIRYAIGVVVGAEGDLFSTRRSTMALDYDTLLPTHSLNVYYRAGDEERLRIFPIDPYITHTRITSESIPPGGMDSVLGLSCGIKSNAF